MKANPKISVLMAVYNGQTYLAEAIESILQQTWRDFEFIIINDASTDATPHILHTYAQQDERIYLFENPHNLGLTKSLNLGLGLAEGDYIARQDADDVSLPERFEKQLHYFETHPQTVLVSANADIINAQGDKVGALRRAEAPPVVKFLLRFYNHIGAHSAVMFKNNLAHYDETRRFSQDYELWLRLSQCGEIAILPDVLLQIRQHEQNISHQHQSEQIRQSRADSRHALGEKISAEELELLLQFWLEPFPAPHFAPQIQHLLAQVGGDDPTMHDYIQARWRAWLRSVSLRRQPWGKLRLAWYSR